MSSPMTGESLMQRTMVANDPQLDLRMVIKGVMEKMMEKEAGLKTARRIFENELISVILRKVNGNRKRAARILGVSQSRLSQTFSQSRYAENKP